MTDLHVQRVSDRAVLLVTDQLVPTAIGHDLPGDRVANADRVVATAIRDLPAPVAEDHQAQASAQVAIHALRRVASRSR